jgi:hypothetical protein
VIELLGALALPLLLLAFLRHLSHQWFPWAMRPLERLLSRVVTMFWKLIWTLPVRQWGVLNTLFAWGLAFNLIVTVCCAIARPDPRIWLLVGMMWVVAGAVWSDLRDFFRWLNTPRRLPHRRRGGRGD